MLKWHCCLYTIKVIDSVNVGGGMKTVTRVVMVYSILFYCFFLLFFFFSSQQPVMSSEQMTGRETRKTVLSVQPDKK